MCGPRPPCRPPMLVVFKITPECCGFMTRAACFMPRNTDRSSTAIVNSYSSSGISSIPPCVPTIPALLNMQSSRPNSRTAASTAPATSGSDVTSQCRKRDRSPSSAATRCPRSSWMSVRSTLAPSACISRAVASPSPLAADHHCGPGDISEPAGHRPVDVAPLTAMTAAALATSRLRVGCRVFCVDYHHPVVLAKELATLDMLSQGRVEAGLGAGWVSAEYEGLGIAMDRPGGRIERLAETVELLKAHWAGEPVAVKGAFVRASGSAGRPRPVQQPHPPIFIGGRAPRVLKLAGRLADIVSINFNNAAGELGAGSDGRSTPAPTARQISRVRDAARDRFHHHQPEI